MKCKFRTPRFTIYQSSDLPHYKGAAGIDCNARAFIKFQTVLLQARHSGATTDFSDFNIADAG
jgi:hypothetical protein